MTSTAVLIGNAHYEGSGSLECCIADVAAMKALLEATSRFDHIRDYVNLDASAMRDAVREALPAGEHDEVFFYFSGHGEQVKSDLYLCGTTFDAAKPNVTGMLYEDLVDLFRAASPQLLVTVIDACFSGASLIKRPITIPKIAKENLRSVVQFSSSLDNQTSLAGEPLSEFTRAFLEAATQKTEGVVYYSDLKITLRDAFLRNDEQTPFFVDQGSGREVLVDDARKLERFRERLATEWTLADDGEVDDDDDDDNDVADSSLVVAPKTPKELLIAAEAHMGGPEDANRLTGQLFDAVVAKFASSEFAEFFDTTVVEHSDYREPAIQEFMIRSLYREARPDRLVTAEVKKVERKLSAWERASQAIAGYETDWVNDYTLELNCSLPRAQLKLTLTPKFRSLQQLQLVISCAPSLNDCYIFELVTQHPLTDWEAYSAEGREVVRRWYSRKWDADMSSLADGICNALTKAVQDHIDVTMKRLNGE